MGEYDLGEALLAAWKRVEPMLKGDEGELMKRLARRRGREFTRPQRAWCLAVRASDSRINAWRVPIVPEDAMDLRCREHPGRVVAHEVTLRTKELRWICRPVWVVKPGMEWNDLAKDLGCTYQMMHSMMKRGVLRVRHVKGLGGKRGPAVPIVYTEQMLDPCSLKCFSAADPIWGTTWRYLADHIPEGIEQVIERRPNYRVLHEGKRKKEKGKTARAENGNRGCTQMDADQRGETGRMRISEDDDLEGEVEETAEPAEGQFLGWRWVCPGCRRLVKLVFYPLGAQLGCSFIPREWMKDEEGTGRPLPCFACKECHRIRGFTRLGPNGWNGVVSQLSAGLLYGQEVEKPPGFEVRKNAYGKHPTKAPVREKIFRLLLETDWTLRRIGQELGIARCSVDGRVRKIYREHGVHSREELKGKCGSQNGEERMRKAG